MKFGEKYELLESLTTGGVETFVANDKIRGERVLVHILECEAQKPNQPTVQWVLEAFRHIAPEPAGLVLETGRYSGTLYAYLVTKMPEEAALAKWVQLYKSQARDTQEIPRPPAKPTPESESPTAEVASKGPASMPPSLRDFDPRAKPVVSSVPLKQSDLPAPPLPNPRPAGDRSGVRPASDWNATPPRISVPAKAEPSVNRPLDSFSSAFNPPKFPSEPSLPPIQDGPNPGEFTNFFRGPFRPDSPSDIPAEPLQQVEPPRKSVGEFTAMFNSPRPEEPYPAAGVAGNEPPGAGFTGLFNSPNIASRTSGTVGPAKGLPRPIDDAVASPPPLQEPFVVPKPPSYVAPTPPIIPIPTPPIPTPPVFSMPPLPIPAIENRVAPPAAASAEGATNAFNPAVSEPVPSQPAPFGGPGAYTRVVSVKRPVVSTSEQEASASAAANPSSFPAIAPPPLPKPPAKPKVAAPAAPKLPNAEVPKPPVSYWPLILTLTVLFFIAALLVLYFALKH